MQHLGKTWIDREERAYNTYSGAHTGSGRKGLVRWEDGALRTVTLGVADTFFSVPAHGYIRGRYVSGYVSVGEEEFEFRVYAKYNALVVL